MRGINRKNVLHAAKESMKKEILDELDNVKHDIACEMSKDADDRDVELIDGLVQKAQDLTAEYNNFGKSKRAKRKASISWAQDSNGENVEKPKKLSKKIVDNEALHRVRTNHQNSTRPRAGDWLQEGGLVVQRGSQMPLMVLSIRSNGVVEVLAGGQTKYLRDLSLRPAFEEE